MLVWNSKDWNVDWVKSMEGILTRYYAGTPRAVNRDWKPVIEGHSGLQFVEHKFLPGVTNMVVSCYVVISYFSKSRIIFVFSIHIGYTSTGICSRFACYSVYYLFQGFKDFVIDHFSSISVIARLDDKEKAKVREEYKAILDSHFKDTDQIHIPFYSEFYCVEKRK